MTTFFAVSGTGRSATRLPLLPADHERLEDWNAAFGLDVPDGPRPEVGNGRLTVHNRVIPRQIHAGSSQNPLTPCPYLPAEIAFEHFLEGTLQRIREMLLSARRRRRPPLWKSSRKSPHSLTKAGSGHFLPAYFRGYSSVPLRSSHATGFRSEADDMASQPHGLKRDRSPAGKRIEDLRHLATVRLADRRAHAFQDLTVLRVPRQHAAPDRGLLFDDDIPVIVRGFLLLYLYFAANCRSSSARFAGSPGSGSRVASRAARQAANGRRAGQT